MRKPNCVNLMKSRIKEYSFSNILKIRSGHWNLSCFDGLLLVSFYCLTPILSVLYYSAQCSPQLNTLGPVRMWEKIYATINPVSNLGMDTSNSDRLIPSSSQFLQANDSLSQEPRRISRLPNHVQSVIHQYVYFKCYMVRETVSELK